MKTTKIAVISNSFYNIECILKGLKSKHDKSVYRLTNDRAICIDDEGRIEYIGVNIALETPNIGRGVRFNKIIVDNCVTLPQVIKMYNYLDMRNVEMTNSDFLTYKPIELYMTVLLCSTDKQFSELRKYMHSLKCVVTETKTTSGYIEAISHDKTGYKIIQINGSIPKIRCDLLVGHPEMCLSAFMEAKMMMVDNNDNRVFIPPIEYLRRPHAN